MEKIINISLAEGMKQNDQIAKQASELLATAQCYEIDCSELYDSAGEELKRCKAMLKMIDEIRKPITRNLDAAKKGVMDIFRPTEDYLQRSEKLLKAAMVKWQTEQERIRLKEEARQRAFVRQEQEKLRQEAEAAIEKGDTEQAEALQATAALVPMPIVESNVQKLQGINMRTVWKAELVDKTALIQAVAEGKVPDAALEVCMTFLNTQARALKSALNYPGVRAVSEQQIASRSEAVA